MEVAGLLGPGAAWLLGPGAAGSVLGPEMVGLVLDGLVLGPGKDGSVSEPGMAGLVLGLGRGRSETQEGANSVSKNTSLL